MQRLSRRSAPPAALSPSRSQVCKDIRAVLQKQVDSGKEIQVLQALKTTTITRGLKYSLATGNWGQQGTQGIRAGVSQVRGSTRA